MIKWQIEKCPYCDNTEGIYTGYFEIDEFGHMTVQMQCSKCSEYFMDYETKIVKELHE